MTVALRPGVLDDLDPVVAEWLPEIVDRVVLAADPIRIIMFGSHARGDARRDSDVDLLVVIDSERLRNEPRITGDLYTRMVGIPVSKDFVVTTPEQIERDGHLIGTVLRPALIEGITLYERA
jgi:uncharacterized protein